MERSGSLSRMTQQGPQDPYGQSWQPPQPGNQPTQPASGASSQPYPGQQQYPGQEPYGQQPYGRQPYGSPYPGQQPWPQQAPGYEQRPVDINAYAPPKRPGGGMWFIVAALLLAACVAAALLLRPAATPGPESSASARPSVSHTAAGPGMPFTMPNATDNTGRWEVVSTQWRSDGLVAHVRIHADTGLITYGFAAFSNNGTTVYNPETGAPSPELGAGTLPAGRTVEGNVFIPMPRGDSTLILTTQSGRQMSALPIKG